MSATQDLGSVTTARISADAIAIRKDSQTPDRAHDEENAGKGVARRERQTEIIAIYGKGGIGKSFTLANLSYMMAQLGKKVLLIGCDPKSDTTSLLFGGRACPTIIETSSRKKAAGEDIRIGDVCFKRDGVFAMELGGPEVGRGCGGRGIIHGFELLEKLGFHEWDFDYVLLDFLGDVVCGGFGLPIARDMCQKVIVVGSNDLQSLYVANNVCSAVEYFRKLGGNVGVVGLSSTRMTARARPLPLPNRRESRCFPQFRPTKTFAEKALPTKSSGNLVHRGQVCLKASQARLQRHRRYDRRRCPKRPCWGFSQRMPSAVM